MLDLSTYTGDPLNTLAKDFVRELEKERFRFEVTGCGPRPKERKTLRIYWGDVWVAQTHADLWNAKKPFVCLFRSPGDGANRNGVAHAPLGFEKTEFAKQHRCNPDQLHLKTVKSEGKSYLLVRDAETAIVLLRARVKELNVA